MVVFSYMEKTICIFGDSITMGAFDIEQGGWVARLKNYFWQNNYDVAVYNMGVSGDNTDDLLERLKPESIAREPNLIIFAIGINDSQYVNSKDNPRVSLDKFQDNLNKLVVQSKEFTSDVIFIGLTSVDESKTMPIPWAKNKYYDNENVNQYNSVVKSFCEENNLSFVDMLDLLDKDDLDDGLHPNSVGHRKMFERIKDFILTKNLVKKGR